MVEYIYFVKCMDCEDEPFDFFDEAKAFALSNISKKPEIHQTEVIRNDFGECVDSNEIGKVWSWEELMDDIPENTETDDDFHIFTRGDFAKYADGYDPDNDPEFSDKDITFETDCVTCEHPLDEEYYGSPRELASYVEDVISHLFFDLGKNFIDYEDFSGEVLDVLERLYGDELGLAEYNNDSKRYNNWCDAVFCEVSRQLTSNPEFAEVKSMYINESCRKSIPEGKSIKDLVEEMEENEDMVECKHCHELFPKEDMLYELTRGYLCPICIMDLDTAGEDLEFRSREIPEKAVDEEPLDESKKRSSAKYDIFGDSVSLYYNDLEATVQYNQTDVDSWDEKKFYSDEFEYNVTMADFAEEVWNFCIDDESYKEFQERYEELYKDDTAWLKFVNDNAEELMRRYSTQLFDKFESDAEKKYQDEVWEEWNKGYFENMKEASGKEDLLETLEESDDYKKRLTMCPECGEISFDRDTQLCINCGFNTLSEELDAKDLVQLKGVIDNSLEKSIYRLEKSIENIDTNDTTAKQIGEVKNIISELSDRNFDKTRSVGSILSKNDQKLYDEIEETKIKVDQVINDLE